MNIPYWKNLQPLRIPPNWTILQHKLMNIEPKELNKKTCIFLRSEIVYKDMKN